LIGMLPAGDPAWATALEAMFFFGVGNPRQNKCHRRCTAQVQFLTFRTALRIYQRLSELIIASPRRLVGSVSTLQPLGCHCPRAGSLARELLRDR
jgi:hypothetical protein